MIALKNMCAHTHNHFAYKRCRARNEKAIGNANTVLCGPVCLHIVLLPACVYDVDVL